MNKDLYRFSEAVFDLAFNWGHAAALQTKTVAEDSQEMARLVIEWAEEFETKNEGREWNGEYTEEIDQFFEEKYREWEAGSQRV